MSEQGKRKYRPFHEVLSFELSRACIGITSDIRTGKAAEVATILGILAASKMPAAAAHKVAQDHGELLTTLEAAGQSALAELAKQVLEDLAGREDEKKQDQTQPTATQPEEVAVTQ